MIAGIALLIILRHHANIRRLIADREPDIAIQRLRLALAARELDPQERLDWLRLIRTETIGPVTFYAMLRRFGSARAALDMLPRLARRGERTKTVTAPSRAEAEAELAALLPRRSAAGLLGRADYPSVACAIEDDTADPDRARRDPILHGLGTGRKAGEPG